MNVAQSPEQERVWNAYGHAMGAAIGLELVLRIANATARFHAIEASQSSTENKQARHAKVLKNATEGTFSQVFSQFCELYPDVANSHPEFREAVDNAVIFRNHLTHGFLAGRVKLLRSEEGLDLIALECHEGMTHFQQIENYIRDRSGVDFALFASEGDDESLIADHPLAHMLEDKSKPPVQR